MSTFKTAPIFGAAAVGLFSVMGTAMAVETSARPVSQIVLSDEAEVTFVGWNNGQCYINPDPTFGLCWGKGDPGAGQASRSGGRGV